MPTRSPTRASRMRTFLARNRLRHTFGRHLAFRLVAGATLVYFRDGKFALADGELAPVPLGFAGGGVDVGAGGGEGAVGERGAVRGEPTHRAEGAVGAAGHPAGPELRSACRGHPAPARE
eukprot:7707644-Pyramimonas_sp.AAC.1